MLHRLLHTCTPYTFCFQNETCRCASTPFLYHIRDTRIVNLRIDNSMYAVLSNVMFANKACDMSVCIILALHRTLNRCRFSVSSKL